MRTCKYCGCYLLDGSNDCLSCGRSNIERLELANDILNGKRISPIDTYINNYMSHISKEQSDNHDTLKELMAYLNKVPIMPTQMQR